jgi:hypothetical protein
MDCLHFVSIMRNNNQLSRSSELSCMFAGSTVLKCDKQGYEAMSRSSELSCMFAGSTVLKSDKQGYEAM